MRIFRFAVILPALAGALLAACHRDAPPPREFDGPGSFRYIETQVGFGPRIPGTEAHRRMAAWLDSLLRARADTLVTQQWTHVTTKGDSLHLTNFLARFNPAADRRLLFLAHWDSFGRCGEPPAEDQICNGAIDNASGLAVLTETARRLARMPQGDRDIYFLATTAEELGLLGAHAFAENPPLPLGQIVAAFNIDSFAIAPAGTPIAIVGRGMTPLDPQIAAVARQQKRKLVASAGSEAYVRRQDGWALHQHDIPAVMVTSAYGDMTRLEAFFEGGYHRPKDDLSQKIELGGAAEDVAFQVALGRWFADLRRVPRQGEGKK